MTIRIQHVITGLGVGGAERMLLKLLSRMDRKIFSNEVIALTGIDALAEEYRASGIPVRFLGMRRGIPDPRIVVRLATIFGREKPHLVQTWMYHSDLIGGLAARLSGSAPVVWNVRNGTLQPGSTAPSTILTLKICARLSRVIPRRIVCCAESARQIHRDLGYDARRMTVIPNGFDLSNFRPDIQMRREVRRELGLAETVPLIGLIARFDPQKDHATFLQAAGLLARRFPEVRFLLCGHGVSGDNATLVGWAQRAGAAEAVILLGPRNDVARLNAALDIATSASSYGEGFSNSIGEAMACGVPCVVTNIGDSAHIVGDTGIVVPPNDFEALTGGWEKLLGLGLQGRQELGGQARQRMRDHFSLERVVEKYEALYREVGQPSMSRVERAPH